MNNAELIEIQVLFEQASSAFDNVADKMEDFSKKVSGVGESAQKAEAKFVSPFTAMGDSMTDIGNKLHTFGNKLLVLGASWTATISNPLKEAGQDALNTFLEVEGSWTSMAKVTGDSVDVLKGKFGAFARTLSEEYGNAQSDVIDSMNEFVKAGVEGTDQLEELGKLASQTAILFDTDLATGTNLVKQLMQQWGWTIDEVGIGMSIINEIADKTATSELELADAFTVASPAARAFGIQIDTLGGYIASLQSRGFAAKEAGNSLRTIIQYMGQDTDRLSTAFKSLGVEISATELNVMSGEEKMALLANAYGAFRDELGMTEDDLKAWGEAVENSDGSITQYNDRMNEVSNTLGDLVRKRQFPKLIALLDEMSEGMGDGTMDSSEYAKALEAVNMSSDELANVWSDKLGVAMDSAPKKWDILKEKVNNVKTTLGETISDVLLPLAEKLGELADKFQGLDKPMQETIVKVGLIAVAAGPVVLLLSTIINSVATVMQTLGPLAKKLGALQTAAAGAGGGMSGLTAALSGPLGVIAAVAGAFALLYTQSEGFRKGVSDLVNAIKGLLLPVFDLFKNVITILWDVLQPFIQLVGGVLGGVFSGLAHIIEGVTMVVEFLAEAIGMFAEMAKGPLESAAEFFGALGDAAGMLFETMGLGAKAIFGLLEPITEVIRATKDQTAATREAEQATEDLNQAEKDLAGVKLGRADAELAVMDASDRLKTATDKVIQLEKEGKTDTEEYTRAKLEAESANDKLTEANKRLEEKEEDIKDATDKVKEAVEKETEAKKKSQDATNKMSALGAETWGEKMGRALSKVGDEFNEIKNNVVDKAGKWGMDFIQGFIDGVGKMVGSLNKIINNVAKSIKNILGFSVPEEGPMSDADKWMPDMIALMSSTLSRSAPKLYNMVENVASEIKSAMDMTALGATATLTPQLLGTDGVMEAYKSNLAVPIEVASPSQNVVQVHKHFEVRPGVMIASDAEQREFVRHIQKLEEVESLRTATEL